jgi:hypothetical protein
LDGRSDTGDAAWSEGEIVPVPSVFSRLRADLLLAPVPSVAEVERALDGLKARLLQGAGVGGNDTQNPPTGNTGSFVALNPNDNTGANDDDAADSSGVNALFTIPTPVVLQPPANQRPRQRRAFEMSAVQRSARLVKKSAVPAVERAQRNLCRKLGLSAVESEPIETVLQDFVAMFRGPLPPHIVGALMAIFSLDDDDTDKLDDALLQHAGTAVTELSPLHEQTLCPLLACSTPGAPFFSMYQFLLVSRRPAGCDLRGAFVYLHCSATLYSTSPCWPLLQNLSAGPC